MKKRLLLCFLWLLIFLNFEKGQAQFVTIPDLNFVDWLNNNGFAAAMSGNQLDTTHILVTTEIIMGVSGQNISDFDGIQYFDNLEHFNCSYNPITGLPELPITLISLDCSDCPSLSITQLPSNLAILTPNLEILVCKYSGLTNLPALPSGLRYLTCGPNQISTLPPLPSTLEYLDCQSNLLNSFTSLPPSLTYLDCSFNQMSSLPSLPASLEELDCSFNMQISQIPALPASLQILDVKSNLLTSLPSLPNGLKRLYCGYNYINNLPILPSSLTHLYCENDSLVNLPALPDSLNFLNCNLNQLISLPSLPAELYSLECQANFLTSLPSLPGSLNSLRCSQNLLTTLPTLPAGLSSLLCDQNQLSQLPALPPGLSSLVAHNNQLTSLPDLPQFLFSLWVSNNPLLNCLPQMDTINDLRFYLTGVQCLPNYGTVAFSDPPMNSLPLCDVFNINNCDFYYKISGQLYADTNSNCIIDSNESLMSGLKINVYQSGNLVQQVYSSQNGLYTIDTQLGNYDYSVDTIGKPYQVTCPVSGTHNSILTLADSIDIGMDFGIECKSTGHDIGAFAIVNTSGSFFPGDTASVLIAAGDMSSIYNLTCSSGISGTIQVTWTGPSEFAGIVPGSLMPSVSPTTLTYNIADFGTLNFVNDIHFYMAADTSAISGSLVCFTVNVTPLIGDNDTSNNSMMHCFNVINSFDPNDKQVSPVGEILQDETWLTYTVRFQNTGTAPAQHIVILDTLDSDLQEGTFTLLGTSHNAYTQVIGNVISVTFPNINLPDSTSNEPMSHGYFQYKVKSDANLAIGTAIENTAAIYFDFNPPVITNTISTIVGPTGFTEYSQPKFDLFPNPAINSFDIITDHNGSWTCTIQDATGRVVYSQKFRSPQQHLNLPEIGQGTYIVSLTNEGEVLGRKKLVVLK